MALTLYFTNLKQRSCWPVKNVNGAVTHVAVTKKSGPYRNTHPYSTDILINDGGASAGALSLKGTALVPATVTPAAFPGVFGTLASWPMSAAIGTVELKTDDNVAQASLRQSDLDYTHWSVPVTQADPADPDTMLISMDQYPDGYSNRPPSWWVDPEAA